MLKLNRLHLRNIGTYVDQIIDFEPLKGHVFLVEGPNGAGKSTIFDAIMLALTGKAPRFDSSKGGVTDLLRRGESSGEVRLDFTLDGVNYTVSRRLRRASSPHLRLTKMDGNWEQEDGSFTPLTKKKEIEQWLGERGITYDSVLGSMLIPQGEFMNFVASSESKKKRDKLVKNFFKEDTALLKSLESVLEEEEKEGRQTWHDHDKDLVRTMNHLAREAGIDKVFEPLALSSGLALAQSRYVTEVEEFLEDIHEFLERLKERISQLDAEETKVREDLTAKERLHAESVAVKRDFEELERRKKDLATMLEKKEEMEVLASGVEIFEKVARSSLNRIVTELSSAGDELSVVEKELKKTRQELAKAEQMLKEAEERAEEIPELKQKLLENNKEMGGLSERIEKVEKLEKKLTTERKTREREERNREKLLNELERLEQTRKSLEEERKKLKENILSLEKERDELDRERSTLEGVRERLERLKEREKRAKQLHQAMKRLESMRMELEQKELAFSELRREALPRLAALLRDGLVEGEPCPVCGSTHHPHAHTQEEVRGAADKVDLILEMEEDIQNMRAEVEGMEKNVSALEEMAGNEMDMEVLGKEIDEAEEGARRLADISERLSAIRDLLETKRQRVDELEDELVSVRELLNHNREKLSATEATLDALSSTIARLEEEMEDGIDTLRKKLGDLTKESGLIQSRIDALADELGKAREKKQRLQQSVEQFEERQKNLVTRRQKLQESAQESARNIGIPLEEAMSFLQDTEEWQNKARMVMEYDTSLRQLQKEVETLEKRLEGKERPDIERLEMELEALKNLLQEKRDMRREEDARNKSLKELVDRTMGEAEQAMEAYRRYATLSCLKKTLYGKSCDLLEDMAHGVGISLEQYLLTTVYNELVTIANDYLKILSKNRYLLRVVGEKDGVDLEGYDTLMKQPRPLSTLSGGEKFMVALSLAVALKTISLRHHQSGVDLFFIDEGFGALDEGFRDKAAEMLRTLEARNTGITIGFVSHQEELKEAVRSALVIRKDPLRGSEIRIRV